MTIEEILSGLKQIAELLPAPVGPFLSLLATLGQEAAELGKSGGDDGVAVLEHLRTMLRATITAELQSKLDDA